MLKGIWDRLHKQPAAPVPSRLPSRLPNRLPSRLPSRPDLLPLDLADAAIIGQFETIARSDLAGQAVCPLRNGGMLLLEPDDVRAAFSQKDYSNQPSRFSAIAPQNSAKYVAADLARNIPPFLDAPRHTVVRKWLSKAVLSTLAPFEARIGPSASAYVASLPRGESLALVEKVARDFVVATIMEFVGVQIPPSVLKRFTAALFRLFAPIHDAEAFKITNADLAAARAAIMADLHRRREDRLPCLLTTMDSITQMLDELNPSADERDMIIADNALLVLADGVENVEAAIAEVMIHWHAQPAADRPAITETYVRDRLHAATPGQTIARIVTREMHLDGKKLSAGSPVFLSLAAANIREVDGTDFSFGLGRHRCIGERLAVQMIVTCCQSLAQHSPAIDISGLSYEPVFGHRWARGVHIELAG